MTDERSIELEIEVVGTPEEVWQAIATGSGISSWYVPHTVEEEEGGATTTTFGPEMVIPGRVVVWQPPSRVVFDGGEDAGGLAFEWIVETRGDDICVVKLVNSGFGTGEEWDGQFDAMKDGWGIFLRNLQLHLKHFSGQSASSMLPATSWSAPKDEAWTALVKALGINGHPEVGDEVDTFDPALKGQVVDVAASRITLLLSEPLPGVAFLAAEGSGDTTDVSVWAYFYGDNAVEMAAREGASWQSWLTSWSESNT